MNSELEALLQANIDRVRGLVLLYGRAAPGRGRSDVSSTDLLRAAVTFLHASCEDIKFDLQLLAEHHRQRTVQDIIELSVEEALERSTFNNPPELHRALDRLDLAGPWLGPHKRSLVPLMMRRHCIVHRLDRNRSSGRGQHVARSLARSTVERWTKAGTSAEICSRNARLG